MLVVVAGGNVALWEEDNEARGRTRRPASIQEIEHAVFGDHGDGPAGTISLTEGIRSAVGVRVDVQALSLDALGFEERGVHERDSYDSSQVRPELWSALAMTIAKSYLAYEGFVVLHGLDTMAYTAAALSFMLERLAVPVVLTGAQRPLNLARTDAVQNIRAAITIAAARSLGLPVIPEVCVYDHDVVHRGTRVRPADAAAYRTFDSAGVAPLATIGNTIDVQTHLLRPASPRAAVNLRFNANARVAILDVFPGMDVRWLTYRTQRSAEQSPIRGVLLRSYGLGTAPTDESFLRTITTLVGNGVVVMNVAQSGRAHITQGMDPIGLRLTEQGVISGVDMTPEAAYAKMVVLLDDDLQGDEAVETLQQDHSGEQTLSIHSLRFGAGATVRGGEECSMTGMSDPVSPALAGLHRDDVVAVQLRLLGLRPASDRSPARLSDLQISVVEEIRGRWSEVVTLVDDTMRWKGLRTLNAVYDVTDRAVRHVLVGDMTLSVVSDLPLRWERLEFLVFARGRQTAGTGASG